jgi:uncharacterized protein YlxP (DUF503 family)
MYVGAYRIEIFIPESRSLKAKRSVIQSLKTRLGQLNLSVAEVDGQDLWQRSVLGAAAVSSDPGYLDDLVGKIESVVLRDHRANLLRVGRDVRPVTV